MRFLSGVTDQYIYFVAVDATDLTTRETGLASFTVYRSRNGGAAAAYTTPTINETDSSNMPGVYELLLDEDMTLDAGDDSQAVALHITHAGMAPVTLTYELYRAKATAGNTLDVTSGGNAGIDLDNIALTNGAPAAGIHASGTLSGTHSATTADLGANAPGAGLIVVGMTAYFPAHGLSVLVTAYNDSTGVITFDSVTVTLANGNVWYLFPTAPSSGLSADIAAILADTNELQTDWANGGRLDLILDARASQTTADAIETDTQNIQSRIPTTLNNGCIAADVQRINDVTVLGAGTSGDKWRA